METKQLVRIAAASEAVAMLAFAGLRGDKDAIAIGVASLIALALLFWRPAAGVGVVLIGLICLDVAVFTLSAAVSLAANGDGLGPVALQIGLAAISIVGSLAVSATVLRRPRLGRSIGPTAAAVAIAAAVVAVATAASALPAPAAAQPSTARIEIKDTAYSTTEITARAGEIRINVTNGDLFWHTVTIDALGVDLRVPLSGRRSAIFTAPPGVYTYYCQVPGHASAGMRGTLTVQ